MQLDTTQIAFLATAAGAIGWFLNHMLSKRRDQETRKRNFLSFMGQWRSEVERAYSRHLAAQYAEKVHSFRGEAARIRNDFRRGRQRFDQLVQKLSGFRGAEIDANGQKLLSEAIDSLVRFVE